MFPDPTFPEMLSELITTLRMSVEEFAAILDVTPEYVQNLLDDEYADIDIDFASQLIEEFDSSMSRDLSSYLVRITENQ